MAVLKRTPRLRVLLVAAVLTLAGCGSGDGDDGAAAGSDPPTLVIGGIPDQELSLLEERFDGLADHLSEQVGIRCATSRPLTTPRSSPPSRTTT